jgi:flagellar hook assembly protein FlgD
LDGSIHLYPNPSVGGPLIRYVLRRSERVQVAVYNVAGRLVRMVSDGTESAGEHVQAWAGVDSRGAHVHPGVYFVSVRIGGRTVVRQVTLL